ncbi:MAG: hypothetical protein IT349_14855 [Candidatus Eisenbacteria bacterium]|nr:hypothetical protein [Candidatus Eisenbacteria bacterium]
MEEMQAVVADYIRSGQKWPASTRQIATWAIRHQRWVARESALVGQCADLLARAMREEYIRDPQGRVIRAKHAARVEKEGEQLTLWADIRTASREHMEVALQQRRQQIVGDCRQLKADTDSFNENQSRGRQPIQMIFDFTLDVAELEVATR